MNVQMWSKMVPTFILRPGGCGKLVVVEEIPPFDVLRFEYPEKRNINVAKILNPPGLHVKIICSKILV